MNDTEEEVLIEKDEDLKATESRIVELRKKTDRTPEEDKEFSELKKHHRGRIEEQISSERDKTKFEAERAARAEQALEDARQRLKELNEARESRSPEGNDDEYTIINGKKFLTDEALSSRVSAGKMTQAEAWKQQKQAIKEEAIAEMRGNAPQEEAKKKRQESVDYVKTQGYGHFLDEKDPKHNSNDPLYKEANRLWFNGYQYHPDGPRLALEDAKKNLGIGVKRADMSEEFSVARNNAPTESTSQKAKTIVLSDIEQSNAIRFWVHGNVMNPKTGKTYTEAEALQKAMEAKKKRLAK